MNRCIRLFAASLALWLVAPAAASAAALSMAEFLALLPKWEQLAASGESLRIEGRIASGSDRLVRLERCPLNFRSEDDALPGAKRGTSAVEIVGRLGKRNGELIFFVSEMKERPSDAQTWALRESALDTGDPSDWYELAAWSAERGGFYKDRFLLEKTDEARRKGLALERERAAGDAAALVKLAAKAEGFGLAELSRSLSHESLRTRWGALAVDPRSDLAPLLDLVRKALPGASTPLAEWPAGQAARYAAEPVSTYDRAVAKERDALDRLFFAEVQLAAIERRADPAGANGDAIADQIAAALPERLDLAERYRERELAHRLERVETSTRAEALELARRLEERDRGDEAKQALRRWLAAREAAAREDGVAELVPVAEDYAAVLQDKAAAARLLVEVLKQTPDSKEIQGKLKQLGYVEAGGQWITKEEAATRPVDPVALAMSQGRVAVGMSPEQVRKTLGMPDRVTRAASSSQIHEAWIFGEPGRAGLVVHFLRYAARGAEDARVVGLGTLGR